MKIPKIYFLLFSLCLFALSGCATAPVRDGMPSYSIQGVSYVPLVSLCDLKNINLSYDTFTRSAVLQKDSNRVNVRVGDSFVSVNGKIQNLDNPVRLYKDTLVVPYTFKEKVIELLQKPGPVEKKGLAGLYIKKIIIDAGHGGKDPGAIGKTGVREKDVTLDIAKRLNVLLKREGMEVSFTRSTDNFIALSQRVDKANKFRADLFISVHANANRKRSVRGFEVYYVSPSVNDCERALSAAHTDVPSLAGQVVPDASLSLKATLWDMVYGYSRAESMELGRYICKAVQASLNNKVTGIKGARFYVLKGARMPAVLIEVGYLSNSEEERFLKNGAYRQQIAERIKDGLLDYEQTLHFASQKN